MGRPSDELTRDADRTVRELRQGREDLRERVPREVYATFAGRYGALVDEVEGLVADVRAGTLDETEARRRLRRLRRRAAQVEATSIGASASFGPMGPLIRLITVVRERFRPTRR